MGAQWKTDSDTDTLRALWTMDGGLDTSRHPQFIESNKTSDEDGVMVSSQVSVRNRKPRTALGPVANAVPQMLGRFQDTFIVRAIGGTVQRWDGGAWVNVLTGLDANAKISMTNFEYGGQRAILITNGVNSPKYIKADWTTGDLGASAPTGKYIMNDTVRVFIAKGDMLHFCARLAANDWTTANNSGFIQVFTPNGGDITGIIRFLGSRLIFKKDYMGDLHGTNLKEYQVIDVSNQIGCFSQNTLVEVQGILFWLGFEQVYAFAGGVPTPIGDPIKKWLVNVDWDKADLCFAVTDGENYHLGLNDKDNPSDYPNIMLTYNPRFKVWRMNRKNQLNAHGTMLNNLWYTMDNTGTVYTEESGTSPVVMTLTSPAYTEGSPELWKEYYELHVQANLFTPQTTIQVYASPTSDGEDFQLIDTLSSETSGTTDSAHIIPIDTFPLAHWFRLRFVVTGDAEIHSAERFYNLLPADH